jgi:uncharacterized membrane protein HdeD (DUF308 family)
VLFWRGALAIAFGIVAFAWPVLTLAGIVVLFGAFAVVDGALALALAAKQARDRRLFRGALIAEALIGLVAGAIAVFSPGLGSFAIVAIVAGWAIVTGLLEIVAGIALRRVIEDEWALLLGGVVSIAVGIALVARPSVSAVAIAWLLGLYALGFGALLLVLAVRLRRPDPIRRFP